MATNKDPLEYNNTERPATIISQVWNGSAWANSSKRTNSYDGKGRAWVLLERL